jgi:membrane protease subunit HflC
MTRPFGGLAILAIVVVAIMILHGALFTVDPTEQALVLRFGEPVRDVIGAPGLYAKWPFVDSAIFIDKRILDLDAPKQEVLVSDNQRLEVDAFVRYRISDPLKFYQSVGTIQGANAQLDGMLNSAVRRNLGEATIADIVRDKRDALMNEIRDQLRTASERFGLDVVDVRIRRANLPPENSEAVFRRMQTERQQRAATFRAQGSQQSQQIKAEADRKVTVTIAQAQQEAEQIRGQGDAERNRIFAESYGKDPEFFAFYRSMQAYETGLKAGDSRIVLSPKSDFFRYFTTPTPGAQTAPQAPTPAAPAGQ